MLICKWNQSPYKNSLIEAEIACRNKLLQLYLPKTDSMARIITNKKVRRFLLYTYTLTTMAIAIVVLIPALLMRLINLKKASDRFLSPIVNFWAKSVLWAGGLQYTVHGRRHIAQNNQVCYVSNHQSFFDIPLILSGIPKLIGFISKKELATFPILNLWMFALRCPFIDRKNRNKALSVINKRLEDVQQGKPMLIFPEGTRSKSNEMNTFRKSGLQAILNARVPIQPITVCHTYHWFEGSSNGETAQPAKMIIHPIIIPNPQEETPAQLALRLENIIAPKKQKEPCL